MEGQVGKKVCLDTVPHLLVANMNYCRRLKQHIFEPVGCCARRNFLETEKQLQYLTWDLKWSHSEQ